MLVLLPRRLAFPHTWHGACRRFGVHWLYLGVWEPAMLQVSHVAVGSDALQAGRCAICARANRWYVRSTLHVRCMVTQP